MMNFLLTSDKEKAQQNGSIHSCNYCERVFSSRQALGSHLRVHKNLIWKTPNYLGRNNSIDGNHNANDNKFVMSSNLSYGTNRNASSRAFSSRPIYIGDREVLTEVQGTVKRMADMGSSVNGMEKLNNNNYNTWCTRMRFYLLSQDLWSLVGGEETQPPTEGEDLKKWKVRAGKAMYVLSVTVEDDILHHIKEAKTPKEAWDTLTGLYARTNDAKLQHLENELMSMSQQNMTIGEYFTKVKSICQEISKLDPQNPITETRMRRIIVHGLRLEFLGLVTATRGWAKEPTLIELENILENQEALDKQMSKASVQEEDKALFSSKGAKGRVTKSSVTEEPSRGRGGWRGSQQRWSSKPGGAQRSQDEESRNERQKYRQESRCYNCGRKGHFARECWRPKHMEGNAVTSAQQTSKEEEWDFQASFATTEEVEEMATSCIEEIEETLQEKVSDQNLEASLDDDRDEISCPWETEKFGMLDCKPIATPMEVNAKLCSAEGKNLEDVTMYRQLVGSLIYLTLTRPDITYAVGVVSRFMQSPKKPHLEAIRRILSTRMHVANATTKGHTSIGGLPSGVVLRQPISNTLSRESGIPRTDETCGGTLPLHSGEGSTGFHHSNVEAVRSFIRRFPSFSRNLLLKKYHNQNRHSYASSVLCSACRCSMNNFSGFKDFNPHPGLEVSKLVDMKRSGFANLLTPQEAKFGGSSFYRDDNIKGKAGASVRKRFFCEAATNAIEANAPKRSRLRSLSHVGWERNLPTIELHLFKDKNNSVAVTNGKAKVDEPNMDLSHHL
ncbi:Retrovirus-related Pol polyprotein from transposon TNT 1-94 [Senna tora]|uniref:Retrovirus-related Pol polyprotein from transposon TNT 1-94 n=1 Tax=Senna tora TaxID=362788 RepID=A0A834U4S2_9FABA|nr:Retrovirus-related Pol polyprotein from transposon TNT 1-94 [Senna tora]